ncbi:MAG: Ldh family oxidoreductase, partial [Peptococcaceae bacterium]|nr:Ldh family oxidoreductase [Peptococcaceae bacterium]
ITAAIKSLIDYNYIVLGGEKMSSAQLFPVKKLQDFSNEILLKLNVTPGNAEIITDSLLTADLREVKSHGIVRLPVYIGRIEAGVMKADAPVEVLNDRSATALIDANNSFGQVAGHKAMKLAISKAHKNGAGIVAVKNSNHFGITAYYSMLALKECMVGIVLTNASPAMAPYGTTAALLGTNPLSVAIPAAKQVPIVLDMSSSVVARGKIRYAALKNAAIPLGWALDSEGKPTTDPQKALAGSLEPIGGVKGSGLSLVIDILCGVLTATALTGEVLNVTDFSGPSKTGHLFCALSISSFSDPAKFKESVDAVIQRIKALPSAGGGPVYLPGEIEHNNTLKNLENGIPLDEEVVESLNKLARKYGASPLT